VASPIHSGAGSDDAKVICIVVHGRGQSQADMMASVVDRLDVTGARYALPKSEAAGWYAARAIDPLTDQTQAKLQDGILRVADLIAQEKRLAPDCPVLLCGFSQGACLGLELLMRHPGLVDAACLLTGCRVGGPTDDLPTTSLRNLPVYASCGDDDPWIPVDAYERMLATLTRLGARLRTDMFPGRPHEVSDTEISVLAVMLTSLAADRPLLTGAS
jgi:phospholipase/carboxylesterase